MDKLKAFKALRALSGLSQEQLAQKVGTTQSIISFIECGHVEPRGNLKKAIAKTLETFPENLFPSGREKS